MIGRKRKLSFDVVLQAGPLFAERLKTATNILKDFMGSPGIIVAQLKNSEQVSAAFGKEATLAEVNMLYCRLAGALFIDGGRQASSDPFLKVEAETVPETIYLRNSEEPNSNGYL